MVVLGPGAGVSDDDDEDAAMSCISRSSSPIVPVEFVVEFVNVVELAVEGVHSM